MERIARFSKAYNLVLEEFGQDGTVRVQCLLYVALNPGAAKSDIANALGLTVGGLTNIIGNLSGKGKGKRTLDENGAMVRITVPTEQYIICEWDKYETRRQVYNLSEKGRKFIKKLSDILTK